MGAYKVLLIGASMGGLDAFKIILGGLPAALPVPVVLLQHCSPGTDDRFLSFLRKHSNLPVQLAEDKLELTSGTVFVAPADYHLLIEDYHLTLSTEGPVLLSRPSIDVLFSSAANSFGEETIAVILTGKNDDGARGAAEIEKEGGIVIVQDPATAEAKEMPRAAIRLLKCPRILPLQKIADEVVKLCLQGGKSGESDDVETGAPDRVVVIKLRSRDLRNDNGHEKTGEEA